MYKRMLRSALAAAFVVALGLGLQAADGIGGSGDTANVGDIGWAAPADHGRATPLGAPGDIGWFAPADSVA